MQYSFAGRQVAVCCAFVLVLGSLPQPYNVWWQWVVLCLCAEEFAPLMSGGSGLCCVVVLVPGEMCNVSWQWVALCRCAGARRDV